MTYESSDILGGRPLDNGKSGETSMFFKLTGVAALGLFAWLAWFRGRVAFLKWKETRYKKAMRRRHGIPDEDERPFNVAYAAAVRARERADEGGSNGKRTRNALSEGQQSLRQRFNDIAPQITAASHRQSVDTPIVPQIAQAYAQIKQQQQNGMEADPLDFGARYDPNPPAIRVTESYNDATPRPTASSQQSSKHNLHSTDHIRKRSFDDGEDGLEPTKKTRVEGEELIDGDEDASWAFKRGSKRGLVTEDSDEGYESTRGDKRPRNISRDKTPEDQVMEDEFDEDDVTELRSIPRGKKRDRAEAGSTFGGDDDEVDDQMDDKASRRRKRKMISKKKSDAQAQARGRKRDRDVDIEESEDEEVRKLDGSRKKRGKKGGEDDGDGSDISVAESLASKGSYVKGRRIGEEWEVNGVLYKVGINGQRLRQALVKKARNKFPMPKDSQHPDREANLEVFVETWLTEDEYKEAKERHELAWQDSPKPSVEPETPGNVQDSPSVKGKNLLWASAAAQESPASKRRPFRESIATTVGLRIDAFPDAQATSRRRVASAYNPLPHTSAGGTESPIRNGGFRTFSKWEKQDLEAEAMAKMRAKLQEQKKASSCDPKSVGLGAPPLAASASAPGPTSAGSAASFTFAKPADKPSPKPVAASFSLGATPSTSTSVKSTDAGKSSMFAPTAPLPSSGESKSQPSISFNKSSRDAQPPSSNTTTSLSFPALPSSQPDPSKPPSAAPTPSGPSQVPNFFGLKSGPSTVVSSITPVPGGSSTAAVKTPFGFSAPMSGFSSASTNPPTSSPLSFGNNQPSKAPTSLFGGGAQPEQKKPEPEKSAQSSGSLLGRMGSFSAPQPTSQAFAAPSTTPSGSPFSFGKTSAPGAESAKPTSNTSNEVAKPTSIFGTNTTSEPPKSTPAFGTSAMSQNGTSGTGSTISASTPKFNFGFTKSSAPSPPSGVTSSLTTPAPEPSLPATSAFGFNPPKVSEATPAPADSSAGSAAPKFKFNLPNMSGGGSPFSGTTTPSAASSNTITKPVFSGFANSGNGSGAINPFSATPAASSTPAPPKSSFSFGNTGGTAATKPADAPKPTLFGGNTTSILPTSSAPPAPTGNSQPAPFSFGLNNTSSNNSSAPSPFGAQPSTTLSSNGAQSVFGKTSTPTPSAFGFGSSTTSSGGVFGSFGQSGQNQQEKK